MSAEAFLLLVLFLVGAAVMGYAFYRSHQTAKENKQVAARLKKINSMVDIKLDVLKNARQRGTHV